MPLDALARQYLAARADQRQVIADIHARYFGARLDDKSLTPSAQPSLGTIRFHDWLSASLGTDP
jgi:hypothetical protein